MKTLNVQMMDAYLIFQGTLPWQPNNVVIPLAFVPLMLENELEYHGLTVRLNCGDDRLKIW